MKIDFGCVDELKFKEMKTQIHCKLIFCSDPYDRFFPNIMLKVIFICYSTSCLMLE
jgi:hypothetical protein